MRADDLQRERFGLNYRMELLVRRAFRQAFLLGPVDPVRVEALLGAVGRFLDNDPAALDGYLRFYPDGAAYLRESLSLPPDWTFD